MTEGERLAEFSLVVRDSTLKRLREVPRGHENHRPEPRSMSFADLAQHLIDADAWVMRKLEERNLGSIAGKAGIAIMDSREGYSELLSRLERSGIERASRLKRMSESELSELIPDERFGGKVSAWWVIVRGNLDHEIHHRGQIDQRLRDLLRNE